jgi:leucyl-tRNA synthetase
VKEPFQKLVNQGMILGEVEYTAYQVEGQWVDSESLTRDAQTGATICKQTKKEAQLFRLAEAQVTKKGDGFVLVDHPDFKVDSRAHKMSKSRGNVVNPDEIVREYGADSLRLYEMFMGPLEATKPWSMSGVSGVRNFLDRVWRMIMDVRSDEVVLLPNVSDQPMSGEQAQMLHRTIATVTDDLESMSFNTAIARLMEFVNFFTKQEVRPRTAMCDFTKLLSPLAPHLAEELWQHLGHSQSLAYDAWPSFDPALTRAAQVEVPLQINGKVRAKISVPAECSQEELQSLALADSRIAELTSGKQILKIIVVPGRLVNVVIR